MLTDTGQKFAELMVQVAIKVPIYRIAPTSEWYLTPLFSINQYPKCKPSFRGLTGRARASPIYRSLKVNWSVVDEKIGITRTCVEMLPVPNLDIPILLSITTQSLYKKERTNDAIMTSDYDKQERFTLELLSPVRPGRNCTGIQGMRKGEQISSGKTTIHTIGGNCIQSLG